MQWTALGTLVCLILLSTICVLLVRILSKMRLDRQNDLWREKTAIEILSKQVQQLQVEKTDLLNRLMSGDLRTYSSLTAYSPTLSTQSVLSSENPQVDTSDFGEWLREQQQLGNQNIQQDLENMVLDLGQS